MHESIIAEAVRDPKFVARFWSKVNKDGECWEWTGQRAEFRGQLRYGKVRLPGNKQSNRKAVAHRVAWAIYFGAVPAGDCVLHACDNVVCVRREHLFIGTKGDNNRDKAEKGRAPRMCFEDNGNAKVTRADMAEILAATERGESQSAIARRLGVHASCVWHHLRRHRLGFYA